MYISHKARCKQTAELKYSHQVRPSWDDSEELMILVVCPECGAYDFIEFDPKIDVTGTITISESWNKG